MFLVDQTLLGKPCPFPVAIPRRCNHCQLAGLVRLTESQTQTQLLRIKSYLDIEDMRLLCA